MTLSLFDEAAPGPETLDQGAVLLRGFALADAERWIAAVQSVAAQAAFRTMQVPGGKFMSVAITNCGQWGWTSDIAGYRYSSVDPLTQQPWPAIPAFLQTQAQEAAALAGYPDFAPDACLINRYLPGAKLSLHQDKDERDLRAPIVSVSLGLPAVFQFGGLRRNDPLQRVLLEHGDVVVWGGESRLFYHGIQPLKEGDHPQTGACRYNLTFRLAGGRE